MPIPIDKFQAASQPLPERIIDLLSGRSDAAFSLFEIVAAVEGVDESSAQILLMVSREDANGVARRYAAALDQLVKSGRVSAATVGGLTYYAHRANVEPGRK